MKKWLQFGNRSSGSGPNFDISLKELIDRDSKVVPKTKIPLVLANLLKQLGQESRLKTEGILRISGSVKAVKSVKDILDKDADADIHDFDTFVLGDVLKLFLRSLPDGLIPSSMINKFLVASDSKKMLMDAVDELDDVNYYCLKEIMGLCSQIAQHRDENKMSWPNLALVITPNIFKGDGMADNMRMSTATHAMMVHYAEIFDDIHEDDHDEAEESKEPKIEDKIQQIAPNLEAPHMGGTIQSVIDELSGTVSDPSSPTDTKRPLTPKEILGNIKQRKSIDQTNAETIKETIFKENIVEGKEVKGRKRAEAPPTVPDSVVLEEKHKLLESKTKDRPHPARSLSIKTDVETNESTKSQDLLSPKSILKVTSPIGGSMSNMASPKSVRFELPASNDHSEDESRSLQIVEDDISEDSDGHWDEDHDMPESNEPDPEVRIRDDIPDPVQPTLNLNKGSLSKLNSIKEEKEKESPGLSIVTNQTSRLQNIEKLLATPINESPQLSTPTSARSSSPTRGLDVVFQIAKAKLNFWKGIKSKSETAEHSPTRASSVAEEPPARPSNPPPKVLETKTLTTEKVIKSSKTSNEDKNKDAELPYLPSLPAPPVNISILAPLLQRSNIQIREFHTYLRYIKIHIRDIPQDAPEYQESLKYYQKEKRRLRKQIQKYRILKAYFVSQVEEPNQPPSTVDKESQMKNFLREKHVLKKEIKRIKDEIMNLEDDSVERLSVHLENIKIYYNRYQELKQILGNIDNKA